jgi:effector-binding domain-containing protein
MKAQWIVLIVLGGLAALGLVLFLLFKKGPDLSAYLPLKEPRITARPDERVLEVAFDGPADSVIMKAYGVLFKAYFRTKGSPKGPAMKPPKARYELPAETYSGRENPELEKRLSEFTSHSWKGSVAIPLPVGLAVASGDPSAEGMVARPATWKYGEVAEILHLGPYETEPPTIKKLHDYIASLGYRIVGEHEEEYLKGPGMARVLPKDYWTILRYRVEKAQ